MRLSWKQVTVVAALVLAVALVTAGVAWAAPPWSDATDAWWQASYGVSQTQVGTVAEGYADGTFKPSNPISRAQFAKMAVSGLGIPPADPASATFKDVDPGTTYYRYVEGAYASGTTGLIQGYVTPSGLYFEPASDITRAQAFTILGRFLSQAELRSTGVIHGLVLSYGSLGDWFRGEGKTFYLDGFEDASQIASDGDEQAATAYLVLHHVIEGNNFHLTPSSTLTRAQAAVLVLRADGALEDLTGLPNAPTNLAVTPGSPSNDPTPLVSGVTIAGAFVTVYDSYNKGYPAPVASDAANSAGYFYANIMTPLAQGMHLFTVTVKNSQGLTSKPSAPVTYLLDTVAPTGSLTSPSPGAVNSRTPVVTATAADTSAGVKEVEFQYASAVAPELWQTVSTTLSPAAWQAVWGSQSLADGNYLLRAIITDNAGNSFTTPSVAILVDTTAPTGEITLPIAGPTNSNAPTFQASVSDAGGSGVKQVAFEYASADTPSAWNTISTEVAPSTSPSLYIAQWGGLTLADGDYLLRVVAIDNVGNTFTSPAVAIVVDTTPPVASIITPVAGTVGPTPGFTVLASDQSSGVKKVDFYYAPAGNPQWTLISTASAPSTLPSSYTADWGSRALASGSYVLEAIVTDKAGNVLTTASVSVTVP